MNGKPLNIVIVDDSVDLLSLIEQIFTLDGHSVRAFSYAKAAIDNRQVIENADVLISDYYMPDMNGLDLISLARKIKPELPVILLSGAREPELILSVHSQSRAKFLQKPVDMRVLENQVYELAMVSA